MSGSKNFRPWILQNTVDHSPVRMCDNGGIQVHSLWLETSPFRSLDRCFHCGNLSCDHHIGLSAHTFGNTKFDQVYDSCLGCLVCCLNDGCCVISFQYSQGTDFFHLCGSVDSRENRFMRIAQDKAVDAFSPSYAATSRHQQLLSPRSESPVIIAIYLPGHTGLCLDDLHLRCFYHSICCGYACGCGLKFNHPDCFAHVLCHVLSTSYCNYDVTVCYFCDFTC